MAEYTSHRIDLSTPNSRIELFMNDECVGQVDIELKAKVTMYDSNSPPKSSLGSTQSSISGVSRKKQVDMTRGVLQLEQEHLLWNRKMLRDQIGYKNYRDVNKFIEYLISIKHLIVEKEGKMKWFRSNGTGQIWLQHSATNKWPKQ